MSKRLKALPHPDFTFVRGHCGRDAIRIDLPSGGIGIVATTISLEALSAFAASLRRKIAKPTRLARAGGHAQPTDAGGRASV